VIFSRFQLESIFPMYVFLLKIGVLEYLWISGEIRYPNGPIGCRKKLTIWKEACVVHVETIIHDYQGERAILLRKCHPFKDCPGDSTERKGLLNTRHRQQIRFVPLLLPSKLKGSGTNQICCRMCTYLWPHAEGPLFQYSYVSLLPWVHTYNVNIQNVEFCVHLL